MHRDEIMKADLLSEVVLLGSGIVILISLLLVMALAVTQLPLS